MMDSFGVAEEILHVSFPGYRVAICSLITYIYWTYATYYYYYCQGVVLQLGLGLGLGPGNGIFPFFFFSLCRSVRKELRRGMVESI